MVDEDFVMGYAVGFNDGVGSGGSGGSLDDYPVFPKKFRLGDSDFYFMVGDINTGFYDAFNTVNYDSTSGTYSLRNAVWYRPFCIILCKGSERFAVFKTASDSATVAVSPSGTDSYVTTTYYLDNVSCAKIAPSQTTGEWIYRMTYECHYSLVYSDGSPERGPFDTTFTGSFYGGLYFNEDGTISRAPSCMNYSSGNMHCFNAGYFAELMDLMLTLPDIKEE